MKHIIKVLFFLSFIYYCIVIAVSPTFSKQRLFCHGEQEIAGDMEPYFVPETRIYKNSSQGMCIAGDYVIYTRFTHGVAATTYVVLDRETKQEVNHFEFNTRHSNSLTYNPDDNEVVAVSESHAFVFDFQDGEMTLKRDVVMNHNCPKIAYVPQEHAYYLGTTTTVFRTTDFTNLQSVFNCSHHNINQGMGFDGKYLYIIWYAVGHNDMDVYDLSGKFIRTFSLNSDIWREIEDVDFVGDTMYLNIANSGSQDGIHMVKSTHAFSDWKVDKEATCAVAGKQHHVCTLCKLKVSEVIPATGLHTASDWQVTKEPTCVDKGEHIKTCTVCGLHLTTEPIPELGHDFTRWEITQEADVLTPGSKDRNCKRCDYAEHIDIPTLPAYVKLNVTSIPLQKNHKTNCVNVELNKGDKIKNWISSDESIVTVDYNGEITAHKRGTATITVRSEGNATSSFTVKVQWLPVFMKSIKAPKNITVSVGKTTQLVAEKRPLTSTMKLKYSSSDEKVVTVSKDGKLKGIKKGKATITITSWFAKTKTTVVVN